MNIKKILLTVILISFSFIAKINAQITTNEPPVSLELKDKINFEKPSPIKLEPPDLQKVTEEDEIADKLFESRRFAYPVLANFNPSNSGYWTTLDDGSKLWRLELVLPGALSTHTIYDKFWLPAGGKFFVYNERTESYIGAITSEFINKTKENPATFTTGILLGEHITYEYYQPASSKEIPIIEISRIDYGYRFLHYTLNAVKTSKDGDKFLQGFGEAGYCQTNINCPEGADWAKEKNAVALVLAVLPSPHGSTWCSGALVNNTNQDYTPYLLTADHAMSTFLGTQQFDALSNNNLANWVFYWHYEHPTCDNSNILPRLYSTTGAIVVANDHYSTSTDFALLKLTQDPKDVNGVTPYYLGWDATGNSGTGGVCIHHPQGDVKKIANYNQTPQSAAHNGNSYNYWRIVYVGQQNGRHSVTETCSSGSPLINNNHKVIGQLYGRSDPGDPSDCSGRGPRDFGKFSVAWNNNTTIQRQLKHWLDPNNTGTTVLNGIDYSCPPILTGTQPPPSSYYRLVECEEIHVQDATVPAGSTLILDATHKTTINPNFKVEAGASFTIR